jgi:hypothetical protein
VARGLGAITALLADAPSETLRGEHGLGLLVDGAALQLSQASPPPPAAGSGAGAAPLPAAGSGAGAGAARLPAGNGASSPVWVPAAQQAAGDFAAGSGMQNPAAPLPPAAARRPAAAPAAPERREQVRVGRAAARGAQPRVRARPAAAPRTKGPPLSTAAAVATAVAAAAAAALVAAGIRRRAPQLH